MNLILSKGTGEDSSGMNWQEPRLLRRCNLFVEITETLHKYYLFKYYLLDRRASSAHKTNMCEQETS